MQDVPHVDPAVLQEEIRVVTPKLLEVQDTKYTMRTSRIAKGEQLAPHGTVFLKVEIRHEKVRYRNHMLILTSLDQATRKLIADNLVNSIIQHYKLC